MSRVEADGITECCQRLVELVDQHVLVSEQRVRIREKRVNLDRSLEIANRRVVLLLKTKAVAGHTPRLCTVQKEKSATAIVAQYVAG